MGKAILIWVTIIFNVAALIVIAVLSDFILIANGDQSITAWLRENPGWFWWPACFVVFSIAAFACHLYVR